MAQEWDAGVPRLAGAAPRQRRVNGAGLASVIVGALGVISSMPIIVVVALLGTVVWGGFELSDSAQVDVVVGLLSWFVAVPLTGVLGLAGLITAIVGLFRRPRVLPGVGFGLSLTALLLTTLALTLTLLFSATVDAVEPLLSVSR